MFKLSKKKKSEKVSNRLLNISVEDTGKVKTPEKVSSDKPIKVDPIYQGRIE